MTISRMAVALVVLSAAAPVAAQLSCGDTIGKGERVTLAGPLGPCDNDDAAAVVVDGGSLDLGGFTITCADTDGDGDRAQGVVLLGKKSKVMNGGIAGCSNGVGLAGTGKHLVQGLAITGSTDDGIDIAAGVKNRLIGNTVTGSASDGIYVRTDKNKLSGNVASNSGEDGIDIISTSDKNKLSSNRTDGNGDAGIEVGGGKNIVKLTTATGNGEEGIDLGGSKNKVLGGVLQGNGINDIEGCAGNKVKNVTFTTASSDCQ